MEKKEEMLYGIIIGLIIVIILLSCYSLFSKIFSKPDNSNTEENISNNKAYQVGDEIVFNKEKWHVIKDSTIDDDYVVVIKDTPLESLDNKTYYECPEIDDNNLNCSGKASSDYNDSLPKKYFDETYINLLGKNNLKLVDNYYIRLITVEELVMLGCNLNSESCENAPSWLVGNDIYWTMSKSDDDLVKVFGTELETGEKFLLDAGVFSYMSFRPVINLLKSSISA